MFQINKLHSFNTIPNYVFQVLFINGHSIAGMLHEQVVNLIRDTRETASGELLLTVKPSGNYIVDNRQIIVQESFIQVYKNYNFNLV